MTACLCAHTYSWISNGWNGNQCEYHSSPNQVILLDMCKIHNFDRTSARDIHNRTWQFVDSEDFRVYRTVLAFLIYLSPAIPIVTMQSVHLLNSANKMMCTVTIIDAEFIDRSFECLKTEEVQCNVTKMLNRCGAAVYAEISISYVMQYYHRSNFDNAARHCVSSISIRFLLNWYFHY